MSYADEIANQPRMNLKVEYEGGAGNEHRKFALEVLGLGHGGVSGPDLVAKIVAALATGGDAQWVLDLGDVRRTNSELPALER